MKTPFAFLLCGLLALPAALTRGQEYPTINGYVTRAASGSDFDVNGVRILCTEQTRGVSKSAHGETNAIVGCPGGPPYVGESLVIYYSLQDTKTNSVYATRIEVRRTPALGEISGSAVIDAAPAQEATGAQASGFLIRADGFRIWITSKTKIKWNSPLQSSADVKAGNWIKYKGMMDAAGVLVAATVQIGPNIIDSKEESLRTKNEYDPSAVPAQEKQNLLKDSFAGGCGGLYVRGCDPKKFPPFKDAEMQARVEKIGNSLVPAYQRALLDSDPAKIDFRYQLIDTKLFREALTLPDGIILVPHQVVERLQNDAQLAAVVADAMACALERQEYRAEGKQKTAVAVTLAGAFVPYAGPSIAGTGESYSLEILMTEMEQRSRVSLTLLHDAGYDIDQAPIAWWLLAPGKQRPLSEIEIPDRAGYLYRILGEAWHNPVAKQQSH